MKKFAVILLAFGLLQIIVSVPLALINLPGSPERIVSWFDVGLGTLMVFLGAIYLLLNKIKQRKNTAEGETQ